MFKISTCTGSDISAGLLSLCWVVSMSLTFTACSSPLSDHKCIISCSPGLLSPFGGQVARAGCSPLPMWCSIIDLHLVREQQMWVAEVWGDSPIIWEWGQGAGWLCSQDGCSSSQSPPKSHLHSVRRRVLWYLSGVFIQWKFLRAFSGREKGQAGWQAVSSVD